MSKHHLKQQIITDLKSINPEKIILFGSLITEKFNTDKSDIDLLIIKDTKKTPAERYSEARLALSLDYPFDIFVLNRKELKDRLLQSFFFREIVEKGEVLYEAKKKRSARLA